MFPSDIGFQNVELLLFIQRHDFVTPVQLARMRGKSDRATRYLLENLLMAGYLDKTRSKGDHKKSFPYQYFITDKSKKIICEVYEGIKPSSIRARRKDRIDKSNHNIIYHYAGINDFFSRVIAQGSKRKYPGVKLWANQRECVLDVPHNDEEIRPDGYAIFQTDNNNLHFLFEYDRGTERFSTIIRSKYEKYLRYAESELYIYNFDYPSENIYFEEMPKVLFLTISEKRANNMKDFFESTAEKEDLMDIMLNNYFLFSWENKEFMKDVLGKIWLRAGNGEKLVSILDHNNPLYTL